MPFKFQATLATSSTKVLWTKAIFSLSTLSDTIKLTLRQGEGGSESSRCHSALDLCATNLSHTCSLVCCFNKTLFEDFSIEGTLPAQPSDDDSNRAKSFSFLVNSKTLSVLFKDCGENSSKYKLLLIHGDEQVSAVYSNKLFIEFDTRDSVMTKSYSVSFRPGIRPKDAFDMRVAALYEARLDQQALEPEKGMSVHHCLIDTSLIRNFLYMFPSALEDFKVEVDPRRRTISFHGFNRQQLLRKNSAVSKVMAQPMNLSIQLQLDDLMYQNVGQGDRYGISFRLRDLKTFMQLISDGGSGAAVSNSTEFMFTRSGEPIVFERKYDDNDECVVCLIAMTDGEDGKIRIQENYVDEKVVKERVSQQSAPAPDPEPNLESQQQSMSQSQHSEGLFVGDNNDFDQYWQPEERQASLEEEPGEKRIEEDDTEMETQSQTAKTQVLPKKAQPEKSAKEESDTDLESDSDSHHSDTWHYMGPTQNVVRFKGIFD